MTAAHDTIPCPPPDMMPPEREWETSLRKVRSLVAATWVPSLPGVIYTYRLDCWHKGTSSQKDATHVACTHCETQAEEEAQRPQDHEEWTQDHEEWTP